MKIFGRLVDQFLHTLLDAPVVVFQCKVDHIRLCTLAVYADRFVLTKDDTVQVLPFADVTAVSVLGRNKLNIYVGAEIVQLKADERFCALKYMHTYYRAKNEKEGNRYAEFLGL